MVTTSDGYLLAGKVRYHQPTTGFRSGIEPVLLAASVPARGGQRVLEAGTGAGAALLCLAHRVPAILATGVEVDAAVSAVATQNARQSDGIEIVTGDVLAAPLPALFDHAIANPPYHPPDGSPSPDGGRERAKRGSDALTQAWIARMSGLLRRRGTLTLIVPAWLVPSCLGAMSASGSPCSALFPLWPKVGRSAKLVLLRGIKDGRGPMRVLPGLVLHQEDGSFTHEARAVLDDGGQLSLDR
jgi:tRNA1Val (adenine37-N6)-methyltransferase